MKNRVSREKKKHTVDSQKAKRETKYKRKSWNYKMKKKKNKINGKTRFKIIINTYLPVIPFNFKGLPAPIKRYRVIDWNKKKKIEPTICCLQATHFRAKDTCRLKNIFHVSGNDKKLGFAILISDKIDFERKAIKEKDGYYIMIKEYK